MVGFFGSHVHIFTLCTRCTITRRAEVEIVMDLVQVLKDQWDQFSAPLFMRRNLLLTCKVLTTFKHIRLSI